MKHTYLKTDITVPGELWANNILPEGILERWIFGDDTLVDAGDPVASVRIEGALHTIVAPTRGRLNIGMRSNSVIEPGTTIGAVSRTV